MCVFEDGCPEAKGLPCCLQRRIHNNRFSILRSQMHAQFSIFTTLTDWCHIFLPNSSRNCPLTGSNRSDGLKPRVFSITQLLALCDRLGGIDDFCRTFFSPPYGPSALTERCIKYIIFRNFLFLVRSSQITASSSTVIPCLTIQFWSELVSVLAGVCWIEFCI